MISSEHRWHANLASSLLRCLVQVRYLLVWMLHARIDHNLRVLDKFVRIIAFKHTCAMADMIDEGGRGRIIHTAITFVISEKLHAI